MGVCWGCSACIARDKREIARFQAEEHRATSKAHAYLGVVPKLLEAFALLGMAESGHWSVAGKFVQLQMNQCMLA
jgi:hypothetical protein